MGPWRSGEHGAMKVQTAALLKAPALEGVEGWPGPHCVLHTG